MRNNNHNLGQVLRSFGWLLSMRKPESDVTAAGDHPPFKLRPSGWRVTAAIVFLLFGFSAHSSGSK
jgi:hypothetical protein